MRLSNVQTLIIIVMLILGTVTTRFLPFVFFPDNKKTPQYIVYLGNALPYAMMGLLVVYCLKGVSLTTMPYGLPEFIAIAVIVVLHKWKNNIFISIGAGTALYMVLVQHIFI